MAIHWTWLQLVVFAEIFSPAKPETSCPCGWTNRARIVGGKETRKNEYPFMAAIRRNGTARPFCGGTLITDWHVLTAAHCTDVFKAGDIQVVLGEHNSKENNKNRKIFEVAQIVQHKEYTSKPYRHDISLLVTAKRVPFSQTVGPACMPVSKLSLLHEVVKVLGWGLTADTEGPSDVLREVDLPVIEYEKCHKFWPNVKEDTMICTHHKDKDSCRGDSGGPVIWLDPETNRYTMVGLVSYGGKFAILKPGVNTDVSAYLPWLEQHLQETKPGIKTCGRIQEDEF